MLWGWEGMDRDWSGECGVGKTSQWCAMISNLGTQGRCRGTSREGKKNGGRGKVGKRGGKEVGTDPVSRMPQETSRGCRGTWQGPELRTWHAEGREERGELSGYRGTSSHRLWFPGPSLLHPLNFTILEARFQLSPLMLQNRSRVSGSWICRLSLFFQLHGPFSSLASTEISYCQVHLHQGVPYSKRWTYF